MKPKTECIPLKPLWRQPYNQNKNKSLHYFILFFEWVKDNEGYFYCYIFGFLFGGFILYDKKPQVFQNTDFQCFSRSLRFGYYRFNKQIDGSLYTFELVQCRGYGCFRYTCSLPFTNTPNTNLTPENKGVFIFYKKLLTFPDLSYIIKVRKGQKGDLK